MYDALADYASVSPAALTILRVGYGVLLLLTLAEALPQARRFFTTETYDGYLDASPLRDRVLHPAGTPLLLLVWWASAFAILFDAYMLPATAINACLCYWFFIHTRWTGILRGMGAPGFMTWWIGMLELFLSVGREIDPTGLVQHATVTAFRVDFAAIFFCAGLYKATAGYRKGDGMELGMVNPWWGYFWKLVLKTPPKNPVYTLFNTLAYTVQMSAATMMLFPATREIGAVMIAISFFGISLQIRLGFLCEMVVLCTVLFWGQGSWLVEALGAQTWVAAPPPFLAGPASTAALVVTGLLLAYTALLPFAKGGLYANFYFSKRLWGPLQTLLERYTNLFGLIIWRVFTVDVVMFFNDIEIVNRETGEVRTYARPGKLDWSSRFRYLHVGEFVCLASLFTTLKYHPSQRHLFEGKLIRYARTVHRPAGWNVRFTYKLIDKQERNFAFRAVHVFEVDPDARTIQETVLDPSANLSVGHASSPVREGVRPGSYAPVS